ncbi:hypothetical protein HAX54_018700 [Datura stramonium]|uniref:Uncharacterized protein n=1 Tax=Datura stramonium TaxID=4076 RepID=A0ABS8UQ31_DATST|nr:hypothetical protein [Datura stramonium]
MSEGTLPTKINQQPGTRKRLELSSPAIGTSCNTRLQAEINGTVNAEPVVDVKIADDTVLPKPGWIKCVQTIELQTMDIVVDKIVEYSPDGRLEDIAVIQKEQTSLVSQDNLVSVPSFNLANFPVLTPTPTRNGFGVLAEKMSENLQVSS